MAGNAPRGVLQHIVRVCIIASEFQGLVPNGGIGTFYSTLAETLVSAGHSVTLLFTQGEDPRSGVGDFHYWQDLYAMRGVLLLGLQRDSKVEGSEHVRTSWAVYRWLLKQENSFDVIHFPDYQGCGYYTLLAKHLGLAFRKTASVVISHGPTRWAVPASGRALDSLELAEVDFLEQQSVILAEISISPSDYLIRWHGLQGWDRKIPSLLLPLLLPHAARQLASEVANLGGAIDGTKPPSEFVFFGRLEHRKGLVDFCDALDILLEEHRERERETQLPLAKVTFLGSTRCNIGNESSRFYTLRRAARWQERGVQVAVRDNYDTREALTYLAQAAGARCAVLPSRVDNSPQAILELMEVGVPFIASTAGGIPELIDVGSHKEALFQRGNTTALAAAMSHALSVGASVPKPAHSMDKLEELWVNLHTQLRSSPPPDIEGNFAPASACVFLSTQRPQDLRATLLSLLDQQDSIVEEVHVFVAGASITVHEQVAEEVSHFPWNGTFLRVATTGEALQECAASSLQLQTLLLLDAGVILEPAALRVLSSSLHVSGAQGVSPLVVEYGQLLHFDMFYSRDDLRDVLTPPNADRHFVKLLLGPAVRPGLFHNILGSDALLLAAGLVQKLVVSTVNSTEFGLSELLWVAALQGLEIHIVPELLCWVRRLTAGSWNPAQVERRLRLAEPGLDENATADVLKLAPEGVAAVMMAKQLPRVVVGED